MKKSSKFLFIFLVFVLAGCQVFPRNAGLSDDTEKRFSSVPESLTTSQAANVRAMPTAIHPAAGKKNLFYLHLSDLPQGFLSLPAEILAITSQGVSGIAFSDANSFLFTDSEEYNLFFGFSVLLSSDEEKVNFQKIIDAPDEALASFGANYFSEGEFLPSAARTDFPVLGEVQTTASAIYSIGEMPVALDLIAFRHGEMGVYLLNAHQYDLESRDVFASFAKKTSARMDDLNKEIVWADKLSLPFVDESAASAGIRTAWINPDAWIGDIYAKSSLDPARYVPTGLETLGFSEEELAAQLGYDSFFAYTDVDTSITQDVNILGFNRILPTYEDVGVVDVEMDDLHSLLNTFGEMVGARNFRDYRRVYDLNPLNFEAIGSQSMVADMKGRQYKLELVEFRVGGISTVLFVSRLKPEAPEPTAGNPHPPDGRIHSLLIADTAKRLRNVIAFTEPFRESPPLERLLSDEEIAAIPLPDVDVNPPAAASTPIDLGVFLPKFLEFPKYMLDVRPEDFCGQEFSNDDPFLFVGADQYDRQYIYGFTTLLQTDEDKANFDLVLDDLYGAADAFADFYGASIDRTAASKKKAYHDLGDAQAAINVILDIDENTHPILDVVAFRSGDIGVYMIYRYSAHFSRTQAFPDFPNLVAKGLADAEPNESGGAVENEDDKTSPYQYLIFDHPLTDWIAPSPKFIVDDRFVRVTSEGIKISEEAWQEAGFGEDSAFFYIKTEQQKIFVLYNFFFKTYEEIGFFDVDYDLDADLEKMISLLGGEKVGDFEKPAGSIKDPTWHAALVEIEGRKYAAEMIKTRNENIGMVVFTLQPSYQKASASTLEIKFIPFSIEVLMDETKPFRMTYPLKKAADILE